MIVQSGNHSQEPGIDELDYTNWINTVGHNIRIEKPRYMAESYKLNGLHAKMRTMEHLRDVQRIHNIKNSNYDESPKGLHPYIPTALQKLEIVANPRFNKFQLDREE